MKKIYVLSIFLIFCLHLTAQPNTLKRMWTTPYVLQSHEAGFSFQIETLDNLSQKDSLQVVFSAGHIVSQDGIETDRITFLDDGLEDDLLANDGIYTASNLSASNFVNADQIKKPTVIDFQLSEMSSFSSGSKFTELSELSFVVRWFNPTIVPGVNQVDSNFQHTSHVVNIVDKDIEYPEHNLDEAHKRYYDHLPDDRHSMIVLATEIFIYGNSTGQSGLISNDIEGIGLDLFDDSYQYYSNGVLEQQIFIGNGYENSSGVILHELHHRWGVHMPEEFHMTSGGHITGIFDMNGGGGPEDLIEKIVSNGDNTYNIYYNSTFIPGTFSAIDKYFAGYGPLDDIKFPIKVIPNPTFTRVDTDGSVIYSSEDSLLYITKNLFVEKLGVRVPDYLNARREQRVGMMVRSQKLLTPTELAYFHKIMVELEKTENSIYSPENYSDLCMGEGRLITRITDDMVSVEHELLEQGKIKIFPNPASTELYIESLSKEGFSIQSAQIINSMGNVVLNFEVVEKTKIDIQSLSPGLYFLKFDRGEESLAQQFVKAE